MSYLYLLCNNLTSEFTRANKRLISKDATWPGPWGHYSSTPGAQPQQASCPMVQLSHSLVVTFHQNMYKYQKAKYIRHICQLDPRGSYCAPRGYLLCQLISYVYVATFSWPCMIKKKLKYFPQIIAQTTITWKNHK